jgi:tetratricopeptide (TPR) repeat protein
MTQDMVFYTATMAKVYAGQGNLKKAEEIYRYLLGKDPDNPDLINALSEIEKKNRANHFEVPPHLVLLFNTWIDLEVKYNTLKKLNKIANRF